ncbi:hypothetical protein QMK38_05940 [Lysinibacillus fusiformis]|nr:hypothetical protein [Lysinibacillus fusiformis]
MIKKVKKIEVITCLEVTIEHPLKKNGEVSMLISKYLYDNTYIFSIPYHDWSYQKDADKEINFTYAPSGYNHPENKARLIEAMNEAIRIIENDTHTR